MALRLGKHPMRISDSHKVAQYPLMGPAAENHLIFGQCDNA